MKVDDLFISVFNLGTSAQLSVVSELKQGRMSYKNNLVTNTNVTPKICVPYFDDMCLWTSASLNGGAVFEVFVKELYEWTKQFSPNVTKDDIYSKIQILACKGNILNAAFPLRMSGF